MALLGLTACSGVTGGEDASGGGSDTVTIALGTEPASLDTQFSSDGNARIVTQNIADELVQRDQKGELIPGLAAELPTQKNDTTWVVKLRPRISFSNGEPMTAEVVVENLDRAADPAAENENVDTVESYKSARAVDQTTVEITTKAPDPLMPQRLTAVPIFASESLQGDAAKSQPIGTGPYKLDTWQRGQSIELAVNNKYWGDAPSISSATFRFIPDPGAQEAALRAGEVDLITNLSPDSAESVPQLLTSKSSESPSMILNIEGGITKDVRVRRALNMAIDQKELADGLFGGRAQPQQCQMANPQLDYHNPDLRDYEYNLAKARQLIEQAGVQGESIQVLGTSGRWLRDRETTEALGAAWKKIGLEPDVQILEFNTAYLDALFDRSKRPDAIYISAGNPMMSIQSSLDAIYSMEGTQSSNKDAAVEKMVKATRTETDRQAREQLIDKITQIGCEQAWFVFLPTPDFLYGASERLQWTPTTDAAVRVADMSLQ